MGGLLLALQCSRAAGQQCSSAAVARPGGSADIEWKAAGGRGYSGEQGAVLYVVVVVVVVVLLRMRL